MGCWDRCDGESVVEVADGVAHVFVDQVGVDGDGRRAGGAGGGDDLGAGVSDVAGGPDPRDAGAPGGVDGDPAVGVDVAAEADEQGAVRDESRRHEQRVNRKNAAVAHLHAPQLVRIVDDELVDGAFNDADTAGQHLGSLVGGKGVGGRQVGEVVGPLPNDLRIPDGAGSAADDAEPTVADLLAVTVGTVQDIPGPPLSQARDLGQLITQASRDQHPPNADRLPTVEESGEPGPVEAKVGNGGVSDLAAVAGHLFAAGGQ